MDWFTISLKLLDRILESWNDYRSKEFQREKINLLQEITDEEEKPIHFRDQSIIDRNQRKLFILANVVERESSKVSR